MQTSFDLRRGPSSASLSLVIAAFALLPIDTVIASERCGDRNDITQRLRQVYQGSIVGLGVTSQGRLVEVLATGDGATWSIITTTPEGISCLIAAGEGGAVNPGRLPARRFRYLADHSGAACPGGHAPDYRLEIVLALR